MSEAQPQKEPLISVVVPSYNSEGVISACLTALLAQDVEVPYEVILVDSSTDRTAEIVRTQFPGVRLLQRREKTLPGPARNFGIAQARGTLIALTDSDCIVDRSWLREILRAHQDGHLAIGGSVINAHPWNPISIAEYFLEFREFSTYSRRREIDVLPTNNLSVRREVFERYGTFAVIRASEDVIFIHKLRRHGVKVLFEPRIRIRHCNRRRLQPFLRNQVILGLNAALARRILPLPGAALAGLPSLLPLLPLVRVLRTMQFVLQNRFPHNLFQLLLFLLTLPFFLAGAVAWTMGFHRGTREPAEVVAKLAEALRDAAQGSVAHTPVETP